MTLSPPEPGSPRSGEWELLHELRGNERLMELVSRGASDELPLQTQLRREFPDRLVRAALTLSGLRRAAATKFSLAAEMWFDRAGLDRASPELVAHYKAQRFEGRVYDACCGIGGAAIALASRCDVVAVDENPVACLRTQWNAAACDIGAKVDVRAELVVPLLLRPGLPGPGLVHIAPELHRPADVRAVRLDDYVPGLEVLQRLMQACRGGAISLSPAANFGGKFDGAEIELVSLHGECREALVWFGELAGAAPWRATVLPKGDTIAGDPLDFLAEPRDPLDFLYDPDPAVVRAGLVDVLATELGLYRLDPEEEYLTSSAQVDSAFVEAFEVVAELSNNEREIRNWFRTSPFGEVEIKCRHIHIDATAIRRRLPLPGTERGVLFFVRVQGKSRTLVCRRMRRRP